MEAKHTPGYAARLNYAVSIAHSLDVVALSDINALLDERHAMLEALEEIVERDKRAASAAAYEMAIIARAAIAKATGQ